MDETLKRMPEEHSRFISQLAKGKTYCESESQFTRAVLQARF
jgi:hypothetical protein